MKRMRRSDRALLAVSMTAMLFVNILPAQEKPAVATNPEVTLKGPLADEQLRPLRGVAF